MFEAASHLPRGLLRQMYRRHVKHLLYPIASKTERLNSLFKTAKKYKQAVKQELRNIAYGKKRLQSKRSG